MYTVYTCNLLNTYNLNTYNLVCIHVHLFWEYEQRPQDAAQKSTTFPLLQYHWLQCCPGAGTVCLGWTQTSATGGGSYEALALGHGKGTASPAPPRRFPAARWRRLEEEVRKNLQAMQAPRAVAAESEHVRTCPASG